MYCNSPQLYGLLVDEENKYFIESLLMKPILQALLIISDYKFNLYTILNIGIDLIYKKEIYGLFIET